VRRTWAPTGHTPVLKQPFNWKRLSAIGIISYVPASGRAAVLLSLRPGNVDSDWVTSRLCSMHRHVRGRAVLLWDGLPAHRSVITKQFLHTQSAWLTMEPLPAYAPELNPVEPLWANLSARELANLCPDTVGELAHHVRRGVRRVRANCKLISAFLKHSGLFPELSL
jgi:transposase